MVPSLAYSVTYLRKEFAEYCNNKLQKMGLSQGLLFFIIYVGKHPSCAPKELAEALHMDMGHTTRTIAKLIQGNFLLQEDNPNDRRAHILRLTASGEEAFRTSYELFEQWDNETLKDFTSAEREQLITLLGKLNYTKGGYNGLRNNI